MQRDRGQGEEVPLGTTGSGEERQQGQGMELRLPGDEESEDSDDGPERTEAANEAESFQNFLRQQQQQQQKET